MVLKEWGKAWKLYKESRRLLKAIWSPHVVRSYWYVWAALIGYSLSGALVPFHVMH